MNAQIKDLFHKAEGRYFTELEGELLVSYGETMIARLDTMQALERAEKIILEDLIASMLAKYPKFAEEYGPSVAQLMRRDQAMTLRYAAFSMVLQDEGFIYDKLAVWFRTVIHAYVKSEHLLAAYGFLFAGCRAHLTSEDAETVIAFSRPLVRELETNVPGAPKAA